MDDNGPLNHSCMQIENVFGKSSQQDYINVLNNNHEFYIRDMNKTNNTLQNSESIWFVSTTGPYQ